MTPQLPDDEKSPRANTAGPDRAEGHLGDLDHLDVPEVAAADIYARAGRAAPQTIAPKKPFEESSTVADHSATATPDAAPTEVIAAQGAAVDADVIMDPPLASDAPTTAFDAPTPGQQRAADVARLLPPLDDEPPRGVAPEAAPTTVFAPQGQASTPAAAAGQMPTGGDFAADPGASHDAGADMAVADMETQLAEAAVDPRRGTTDFGLLIFRVLLGAALGMHSLSVFFELFGSSGLVELQNEYAIYAYPNILAVAVPALELTAAVFLILGLMTPIAAAVAIVATAFVLIHQVYAGGTADGIVLAGVLFGLAVGVQFTGPGRIGLDFARGWARRPLASSWLMLIIGLGTAAAMWWLGTGVNPLN